jgi:hypothetical protein
MLRSLAQFLDPQPLQIKLIQLDPEFAAVKLPADSGLVGVPVYWWRMPEPGVIALWPKPGDPIEIHVGIRQCE